MVCRKRYKNASGGCYWCAGGLDVHWPSMAADGEENNAATAGTEGCEKESRSKAVVVGSDETDHSERQMERDSGTHETGERALHGFW